jgi:DNA invertase Pin-like site-specific DNA recombinase
MAFDLATPHGRMMASMLAGITTFERELTRERICSGIAAAKARGKRLERLIPAWFRICSFGMTRACGNAGL